MKTVILLLVSLTGVLFFQTVSARSMPSLVPLDPSWSPYEFEQIDISNVQNFIPRGMNERQVVGSGRVNNRSVGVVYDLSTRAVTIIAGPPETCYMNPAAINNFGTIIGTYATGRAGSCEPAALVAHSFLRDHNGTMYNFPPVEVEGVRMEFFPNAINDFGKVGGSVIAHREQQGLLMRCYVIRGSLKCGQPTIFEVAADNTFSTIVYEVSDQGRFVGQVLDRPQSNLQHGYWCRRVGKCILIDYPGALGTVTTGLNDRKLVAGFWYGTQSGTHSFVAKVRRGVVDDFVTIDPLELGAVSSSVVDINNHTVVGIYTDQSGVLRAYVGWPTQASHMASAD